MNGVTELLSVQLHMGELLEIYTKRENVRHSKNMNKQE